MEDIRLTPTSYIVLGLLMQAGEATPYDLKAMVAGGIGNLWSLQHTQLYAEPERLAEAGYLTETREDGGRRRKLYRITAAGRDAFGVWLSAEIASELPELRDISLLKVFFGADPRPIAVGQLRAHREKLREYQELEQALSGTQAAGPLTTLRAGIGHEREWIRYWADLAAEDDDPAAAPLIYDLAKSVASRRPQRVLSACRLALHCSRANLRFDVETSSCDATHLTAAATDSQVQRRCL